MSNNLTAEETLQFICAYPISGQYAKAVRFLFYPLIFLAFLLRISPWLAAGSLTTIFTFCGVASIHLSAMATFHSTEVLDLDSFVAFHVCVTALIICPLVMTHSVSLRVPSRLLVFALFVLLIWTGVVSFAAAARYHPQPQLCLNQTSPVNINNTDAIGLCASTCSQFTLPMRSGQSPQNVVYDGFFYNHHYLVVYLITCLLTGTVIIGFLSANSPTFQEFVQRQYPPQQVRLMTPLDKKYKMRVHGYPIALTVLGLVIWISLAERHLINLPQSENSDAVGQWGPVVAFIIVIIGGGFKRWLDIKMGLRGKADVEGRGVISTLRQRHRPESGTRPLRLEPQRATAPEVGVDTSKSLEHTVNVRCDAGEDACGDVGLAGRTTL